MSDVVIHDRAEITSRKVLDNGFLEVPARIGRTGIQTYRAFEVGLKDRNPTDLVKLYRPPEEVFNQDSMESFASKPVTDDHPSVMVTAANARQLSIGWAGDRVAQDGIFLASKLIISDEAAIKKILENDKTELSNGYTMFLDMTPGVTPEGEAYDGVQRKIRGNHIALVDAGRCGPDCRVADHAKAEVCDCGSGEKKASCNCHGGNTMADPALRMVTVDGVTISTTDQGAQVIEKLQKQLNDTIAAKDKAEGELAAAAVDHVKALETKDGEITALKSQLPTAETLDALVGQRSKIIDSAKKLLGDTYDVAGKSVDDLKKAAVATKLGDEAVKDKSPEYIGAAFDALVLSAKPGDTSGTSDPVRQAITTDSGSTEGKTPRDKWLEDQANAWQAGAGK